MSCPIFAICVGYVCYVVGSARASLEIALSKVLWSSWLWRLLYTQKVPSSILGRVIVLFYAWFCTAAKEMRAVCTSASGS